MKPYLILYATRQGHTERIGQHLLVTLLKRGLRADLEEAGDLPERFRLEDYAGVIVTASVHGQNHDPGVVRFVKQYRDELEKMATVFLSASLSESFTQDADATPERRAQAATDAQRMIDAFLEDTKWHPSRAVAGALLYTKYRFLLRLVLKRITRSPGETDTLRDYDYTDWAALGRLVDELVGVKVRAREATFASF